MWLKSDDVAMAMGDVLYALTRKHFFFLFFFFFFFFFFFLANVRWKVFFKLDKIISKGNIVHILRNCPMQFQTQTFF